MNIRALVMASMMCAASMSTAYPIYAQSVAEDPLTTMARARFKEGVEFYDKGRYELARASFMQAYALKKHPAVLLNLAWSSLKSGHALDALRNFKQFLSEATDVTDKARADANDGERQALSELGRIDIVTTAGSKVVVDGSESGITPLEGPVLVEPGAHTVTVRRTDGSSESRSVSVLAGETAVLRSENGTAPASLVPSASTMPAAPETPSTAGSGIPHSTPSSGARPLAEPSRLTAAPVPAAPAPLSAARSPSGNADVLAPPANLVPVFLLAGVAIASYATAAGLYVVEQTALDRAAQEQSDITTQFHPTPSCVNPAQPTLVAKCNALATDNDNANSDALWGNIVLGVGIAATAGTLVYWLVADKRGATSPTAQPMLVPLLGPSLAGVALVGSY